MKCKGVVNEGDRYTYEFINIINYSNFYLFNGFVFSKHNFNHGH